MITRHRRGGASATAVAKLLLVASGAALLVSCASVESNKACVSYGNNLIQDSDFAREAENNLSRSWSQSQHAGEPSFTTSIRNGVLTISKMGTQPWFTYRQVLQLEQFANREMVFSADLKLELEPARVPHQFAEGGGLSIVAKSAQKKLLLRSVLDHEPRMGKTGWQQVQVTVQLPKNTRWVTLAFLHQADGTMQVRDPFFGPVIAGPKNCSD